MNLHVMSSLGDARCAETIPAPPPDGCKASCFWCDGTGARLRPRVWEAPESEECPFCLGTGVEP